MSLSESSNQPYVATLEHLGRRYTVNCRVTFDGIEYVGRLWFSEEEWDDVGLPDRAAIPGRSREEVLDLARRLTPEELGRRHRRALAEKRRFVKLRRVTDDILTKIRYMNQIAVSMREGWIDEDGATQEIDLTEQQLHDLIDKLRDLAGLNLTDFGTRRRHGFLWQEHCLLTAAEVLGAEFTGTSNVFLAMKHGMEAKGTNAHELPMVLAALVRQREPGAAEALRQSLAAARRAQ